MKADHKAALNYASYRTGEGWDESTETHNLAAAYLELRELARAIKNDLEQRATVSGEDSVDLSNVLWMQLCAAIHD